MKIKNTISVQINHLSLCYFLFATRHEACIVKNIAHNSLAQRTIFKLVQIFMHLHLARVRFLSSYEIACITRLLRNRPTVFYLSVNSKTGTKFLFENIWTHLKCSHRTFNFTYIGLKLELLPGHTSTEFYHRRKISVSSKIHS